MVKLNKKEWKRVKALRKEKPELTPAQIMEKLSLPASKLRGVTGMFGGGKKKLKGEKGDNQEANQKAQEAQEAENKLKKEEANQEANQKAQEANQKAQEANQKAQEAENKLKKEKAELDQSAIKQNLANQEANQKAQEAQEAENKLKKEKAELTNLALKQILANPEALQLIANEVSGRIVPTIQKALGGNPGNTPQGNPGSRSLEAGKLSFESASELALKVFDMLEAGSSFVDVMGELKLDEKRMNDLLDRYGNLKAREAKVSMMGERYLEGWFKLAKLMGEIRRDECGLYNDEAGICTRYATREVEKDFRNKYPGMLKVINKRIRFHVLEHPEVCSFCDHRTGVA